MLDMSILKHHGRSLRLVKTLSTRKNKENQARLLNPAFAFESRFGGEEGSETEDIGHDDEEAWGEEEDDIVEEVV